MQYPNQAQWTKQGETFLNAKDYKDGSFGQPFWRMWEYLKMLFKYISAKVKIKLRMN